MPLSQRRHKLHKRLAVNKMRAREGLVLVEGVRAVSEALDAGARPSFAVVSPRLDSSEEGRGLRARLPGNTLDVSDAEMAEVADTEHPQGVVLVCHEPDDRLPEALSAAQAAGTPRVLVLDAIQDPGNVGTLVRSAVAFAFHLVVALDGTTDPWGSKAVRAAAGTSFRLPVIRASTEDAIEALSRASLHILVASAEGSAGVQASSEGFALVLGNEGSGVRERIREVATETVAVAMAGPAESLNVGIAGSILMSDFTRKDR
ncbi:MAG: RNA methyltransferase [Longimicrobiales bacterium]|nr:RNA methyltransferase [Longimicrobiales bacterium]